MPVPQIEVGLATIEDAVEEGRSIATVTVLVYTVGQLAETDERL